jgi:2-polyprenyl-3-methyl-5-hydroxy-6-metoxy-1,4-benzoquinol methylase
MSPNVYSNRLDFVRKHTRDREVLDVGPAELVGTVNRAKLDRWPFAVIRGIATSVVGVERDPEQVKALCEAGYEIIQGDAEQLALDRQFDVVFAGELIEHLSNPGSFLAGARSHLRPGGMLALTTPNRFDIHALRQVIGANSVPRYTKLAAGHVFYFDIHSLRHLLERHSFEVVELGYYCAYGGEDLSWKGRSLVDGVRRFRPHLLPGIVAAARRL